MTRALPLTLLAASALCAGTAYAQQPQWASYEYADQNGQPTASVVFGIPETDATLITAWCTAADPRDIVMHLNVDPGPNQAGSHPDLTFVIGSVQASRGATIVAGPEGSYTETVIDRHDTLWDTMMRGVAGTAAVAGGAPSDFHLRGSRAAITSFLASCDEFVSGGEAVMPAGAQPLTGPLYTVSDRGAHMLADFRGGDRIDTLAAGTEVMSTNTSGSAAGVDWVQVVTDRGAGVTGWVDRNALVPTTGGATEYQNLNQVANLVIRAQPSAGAPTVGAIPPLATGILDQGSLEGGWVLIRFGATTGWASHEYLLPLLGPAMPAGRESVPGYHRATYGTWDIECDPCRHAEDGSTCQISSDTGPLQVYFFEGDDDPINLIYYPPQDLHEPEASATTLSLAIDGTEIATLRTPDWEVWEMTGAIGLPFFGDLMNLMRAGNVLTISLDGPLGDQADSFALDGFAEAHDDLMSVFPVENRLMLDDACPFQ